VATCEIAKSTYVPGDETWEATFLRHSKVAEAVIAGDAMAAETAMRQHFEAAEAAIAEIYGSNPASDRDHREDNHA
jgi:GntR family transcriptional repressor for pyruvate dehydrogenase complex